MKTLTVKEISRQGVSRAVREAEGEPVLVSRDQEPVVWMLNARDLARLAELGAPGANIYRRALELIAVNLFDDGVLSMGQAARLAGLPLAEFFEVSDRLRVPILREPEEGLRAQVDEFDRWLRSVEGAEA